MRKNTYISTELTQNILDGLRSKEENYWWYNNIMEYQKIINLLDDTMNQPSIFRTRKWV